MAIDWDQYGADDQSLVLPAIIFGFVATSMIWPTDVIVSVGLTVENLFSSYLGEQAQDPIEYNCKKIVLNRAALGCIPFIFTVIVWLSQDYTAVFSITPETRMHYFTHVSILLLLASIAYFYYHRMTNFENLQAIKYLKLYQADLSRIRLQVAIEFKNYQNFSVSLAYSSRIIISDSWVMNFNRYDFIIVNVSDVLFEAVDAMEFAVNVAEGSQGVQFLRIRANVIDRPIPPFYFRINSANFRDLQDKLTSRIEMTREIILHVSPNERFVEVFKDCVAENEQYFFPELESLEPCIGCYADRANVKISHSCEPQQGRQACRECFCRPLWCVSCLGRVFAGKQDQEHPETWLGGQADCPTCRATFCVRDVHYLTATLPIED